MRLALVLLVAVGSAVAQINHSVRGLVTDESSGVLPGVTVVATAADGRVLATTVTDASGRYVLGPFADARVTIGFRLDGFSPATVTIVMAGPSAIVNQRLVIAPQSETVEVIG